MKLFILYNYYFVLFVQIVAENPFDPGIFFLVASLDMLIIYFSIELQGLCFYTLCVINRYANGATEAAIKYLLMSGLASSLLLFGTSLRYGLSVSLFRPEQPIFPFG